jgi:hypothetical protein
MGKHAGKTVQEVSGNVGVVDAGDYKILAEASISSADFDLTLNQANKKTINMALNYISGLAGEDTASTPAASPARTRGWGSWPRSRSSSWRPSSRSPPARTPEACPFLCS